jgi:hypothetical protein
MNYIEDYDFLLGEHLLSGADQGEMVVKTEYSSEDSATLNFIIDGVGYSAIEDPSDGYRSDMRGLIRIDHRKIKNQFSPVKVVGRKRPQSRHGGEDDVFEFIDTHNGKTVLAFGTENIDDYYPGFIGEWTPENLSTNEARP